MLNLSTGARGESGPVLVAVALTASSSSLRSRKPPFHAAVPEDREGDERNEGEGESYWCGCPFPLDEKGVVEDVQPIRNRCHVGCGAGKWSSRSDEQSWRGGSHEDNAEQRENVMAQREHREHADIGPAENGDSYRCHSTKANQPPDDRQELAERQQV